MQLVITADQGPAHPWAVIKTSQSTPPRLFTGNDSDNNIFSYDILWYGIFLWPVRVSWSGCGHPQLLVQLLSGTTWETGESLTWGKRNLATPESVTNTILTLNPKHSIVPAIRKKNNPFPAKSRASGLTPSVCTPREDWKMYPSVPWASTCSVFWIQEVELVG